MINNALDAGGDLDEVETYCRIFPEIKQYQPELANIK